MEVEGAAMGMKKGKEFPPKKGSPQRALNRVSPHPQAETWHC